MSMTKSPFKQVHPSPYSLLSSPLLVYLPFPETWTVKLQPWYAECLVNMFSRNLSEETAVHRSTMPGSLTDTNTQPETTKGPLHLDENQGKSEESISNSLALATIQVSEDVGWTCNHMLEWEAFWPNSLSFINGSWVNSTDDNTTYCSPMHLTSGFSLTPNLDVCIYWNCFENTNSLEGTLQGQGPGPLYCLLPQKRDGWTQAGVRRKPNNNWLNVQLATDVPQGFLQKPHPLHAINTPWHWCLPPPQPGCLWESTRHANSSLILRFSAWLHKPTKGENVNDSRRYSSWGSHKIFNISRLRKNPPGKIQSIFMLH